MTAILRSNKYSSVKAPKAYNTHIYFRNVEAEFWQLKNYLDFRLKNDSKISPWDVVFDEWQSSLDILTNDFLGKFPLSIITFCRELHDISKSFEGHVVELTCKDIYTDFYKLNADKSIIERIELVGSSIFIERTLSELLQSKKQLENNEEKDNDDTKEDKDGTEKDDDNFQDDEELDEINRNSSSEETEMEEGSIFDEWILSTGTNVSQVLEEFNPIFFGILDLSGEDIEVKNLFTDDEWEEMKSDFNETAEFKEIKEKEKLYELFDRIQQALKNKSGDDITEIEKCIIEGNPKINAIRRLVQNYLYNLERLQPSTSEASFSNNFINMMSSGILTHDKKFIYDEGEIQSLASAMIANSTMYPTDKSLIGQKCDFRVTFDRFEAVIGLRSGGLPEACKSKKWSDKVDLMVAMRDVLLKEGIETNGIKCAKFKRLYTIGVHSYGFSYNVYAMDWKARGLWRLGLLKKINLPQSNLQLPIIEKLVVTLLRVELTLINIENIRNDLIIEASRLHRSVNGRTSIIPKQYSDCQQRIRRIRVLRNIYEDA
ncbi:18794_t:CDS:10 [Acaulospora morrowiae]|uniref:18794_t:CDS:1 n=1 Tax=Acaulospora morrowiae TaxID=94023 RepID=A0A9N9CN10_9GLOM|nr:18794_t:CDS:10 [Acaulospora morrowiae]